jgi:ATP synthase protein I
MTTTEDPLPMVMPSVPGQRSALLLTLVIGAAGAALAVLTGQGERQVLGVLVGAGTVGAFFLFGALTTGFVAAHAPRASLLVALMTYTLQVLLLALLLAAVAGSPELQESLDERWLGGAVLAGALAWTGALVAGAVTGTTRGGAR